MASLLDRSVSDAVEGEKVVAVAFSGGLDSSVVAKCAMRHARVFACTVFAEGALDSRRPEVAADSLGVELFTRKLDSDLLSATLADMDLPFEPTPMDKSLWCIYRSVARDAKDAGTRVLLLGQLADELFGGYAKYAQALKNSGEGTASSMMDEDLKSYFLRGRVRDFEACRGIVQPALPFEAQKLMRFATELPFSFKIRDGERKAVLRRAAALLEVPEEIASAPKKAAQYSSGIQKLIVRSHF